VKAIFPWFSVEIRRRELPDDRDDRDGDAGSRPEYLDSENSGRE
jgi:hypothetical protein